MKTYKTALFKQAIDHSRAYLRTEHLVWVRAKHFNPYFANETS